MIRQSLNPWMSRLRKVARQTPPFNLRLGKVCRWPHVNYFSIVPAKGIRNLRSKLGYPMRVGTAPWTPHLTISEIYDAHESRKIYLKVKHLHCRTKFQVNALTVVAIPGASSGYGRSRKICEIPLKLCP